MAAVFIFMIDVVIPFKHSANKDRELIYALRSIVSFIHDLGNVYIVGDTPKWDIKGVLILEVPQLKGNANKTKEYNIANKLLAAARYRGLSKDFIYTDDDTFLLKPYDYTYRHKGNEFKAPGVYGEVEKNTLALYPGRYFCNYNVHYPRVFNKDRFIKAIAPLDWGKPYGYSINTVYAVENRIIGLHTDDLKYGTPPDPEVFNREIADACSFSIGDAAWRLDNFIKDQVKYLFPNKSKFEV